MYFKYSVYASLKQAELIEDAFCGIYEQHFKFGNDRHRFIEKKLEEFISSHIKKWETDKSDEGEI